MDTICNRLKELRNSINITQEELGEILNVTKQTVSGWETGYRTPDKDIMIKIADYFNISVDFLLGRSNDENTLVNDINLGTKIKSIRINKNMTQQDLASILEISTSTIGMWEQNRRTPPISKLVKLSNVLDISIDSLLNTIEVEINVNKSFGENFKKLRLENNLTQKNLADKLSLDSSSISKYENHNSIPEVDILIKISDIFNVSIDYLLGKTNIKNYKPLKYKEKIITQEHLNIAIKKLNVIGCNIENLFEF